MGARICCCVQHEFIEQGGVVDLQKGERFVFCYYLLHRCSQTCGYANMDYIFASVLKHHDTNQGGVRTLLDLLPSGTPPGS